MQETLDAALDRGARIVGGRQRVIRLVKYSIGSLVAFATSEITFAVVYGAGWLGTTAASAVAFVAGAIPNYVMNRSWAWQRRGRVRFWREVVLYAVVSLVSFIASAASTGWVDQHVDAVTSSHGLRTALVTGTYGATFIVLFVAKFVCFDLLVFADRPKRVNQPGADHRRRSLHHVPTTTRPKRSP